MNSKRFPQITRLGLIGTAIAYFCTVFVWFRVL
jgi:hypothetical protein